MITRDYEPTNKPEAIELETICANRRVQDREAVRASAWYQLEGEACRVAEMLNMSAAGARLVVGPGVYEGQQIRLVTEFVSGNFLCAMAEVRWLEELPGGYRQVVGVQIIPHSYRVFEESEFS